MKEGVVSMTRLEQDYSNEGVLYKTYYHEVVCQIHAYYVVIEEVVFWNTF